MPRLPLIVAVSAFIGVSYPANADQIDGDWCNKKDGQHLTIEGSKIRTPSGVNTEGQYTRHAFTYDDTDAGGEIAMQQYSDDVMMMTLPGGEVEEWNRCDLQTS